MKIDKRNSRHWWYLIRSGLLILTTLPLRLVPTHKKIVVLYGHKLNGNLLAIYNHNQTLDNPIEMYFLTMDPVYYESQQQAGINMLSFGKFRDMLKVSRSKVVITDHGLHTLVFYARLTNIKFVDVWHGVPFKGFIPADFSFLKYYTEIWTTSPFYRNIYRKKLDIKKVKIEVTGYGRVDAAVTKSFNKKALLEKHNIKPIYKKYVLIAPTWKQDSKGRSIVPFDMSEKEFFKGLNELGKQTNALIIFRTHLNSKNNMALQKYSHIAFMPYAEYPVAEDFLFIADILVTDWSSIGFDFLPLKRPTIYLDVPSPFKNGYTLGPEYRFGDVVTDYEMLISTIKTYLRQPGNFEKKHQARIKKTIEAVYGNTLDGRANERYFKRLNKLISE